MTPHAPKHIIDHLTEWAGSLAFTAGMAVAAWMLFDAKVAALVASASFALSLRLLTRIGSVRPVAAGFEPASLAFHGDDGASPQTANDELLLDDPLVAEEGSRVVRLFTADATHPAALVARIEDYLDRDPNRGDRGQEVRRDEPVPDASAALHAALANIRASLR